MLKQLENCVVYIEGNSPEIIPIECAHFSVYRDDYGPWLLLKVECNDYRSIEIGISIVAMESVVSGAVFQGVAYDEAKGGWLTNMYYHTHFGVERTRVSVISRTTEEIEVSVSGDISDSSLSGATTVRFLTRAKNKPEMRKSFA